jgi:hypothetical protein
MIKTFWRWTVFVAQVRHHRQLIHVAVSRRQLVLLISVQSLELVVVLMLVDVTFCPPIKDPWTQMLVVLCESHGLKVGKFCKNAYQLHRMEMRWCPCLCRWKIWKQHRQFITFVYHENIAVLVVLLIIKVNWKKSQSLAYLSYYFINNNFLNNDD